MKFHPEYGPTRLAIELLPNRQITKFFLLTLVSNALYKQLIKRPYVGSLSEILKSIVPNELNQLPPFFLCKQ